ncbi:hypothetical protein [Barnesiella sp. An55]|uniref:hypothetical protein n=1 Tax=Barnesiella sp. An55 TaxID=1965646 RepID=UPI000B38EB44|nr:hypothetical protein [Barnesiella sp. An55]OUN72084.1 hypothetical protein B5G10_08120 [Barnesiella sp. An55]HIZ26025.1 hypothetical protein [Candidatus Barnesiella merdipullorum]
MKTMKTKWVKAGTVMFATALILSSCSNEEVTPSGATPIGDRDAVKTSFSFAIPSPVSRATGSDVQADGAFQGMKNLRLMPFTDLEGDYVGANSVLAGLTQLTDRSIAGGQTDIVETFNDVAIPAGNIAFLFYGEANHNADFNGALVMTPDASVTAMKPTDIAFSLKNIEEEEYTGGQYANTDELADAWKANVTDALNTWIEGLSGADKDAATEVRDNYYLFNSASLKNLQMALQYLTNQLGTKLSTIAGADAVKASVDAMATELALPAYANFPTNLPKGTYKLSNGEIVFDENGPSGSGIVAAASQAYNYPASLYYWANAYPVAYTATPTFGQWTGGIYSGAREVITPSTTKIALNKTINYGVARLDVKAAFKSADGTVPAGEVSGAPTHVTLANHNFVVKGVLVGGLPDQLDWQMHPSTGDTYSKVVYDTRMESEYSLTSAATPDFAGMTPFMYSLLPETADCSTGTTNPGQTPNIALEIYNDGPQFYGLDGNVIPEGGTFYLVGKLTYVKDNNKTEVVRVFQQDYNTTANLTISSLANAYNTVPDLINPRLELSLAVDIDWQAGLVLDVPLGD